MLCLIFNQRCQTRLILGLLDQSVLNLIVFPNDVDITKISNDHYTALMDLGRIDLGFHVGLRKAMTKKNGFQ